LVRGSAKESRMSVTLRVLARLARIVVALLAMQLSGFDHLATDLLIPLDAMGDETDCPNEKPGHDCPPGCPGCHCAHGGIAVPPSSPRTAELPMLGEPCLLRMRPAEADAPSAPALPSIFRPPRRISIT
jgi:hypothetical protein